jgi:hypothetical protein
MRTAIKISHVASRLMSDAPPRRLWQLLKGV